MHLVIAGFLFIIPQAPEKEKGEDSPEEGGVYVKKKQEEVAVRG